MRFTETRHIDSVVDVTTLKADVWRIEHYTYPDSIRLFVRVLDTNGYVVTHMAAPYKAPDAPNYFPKVVERLGTGRKKRTVDVSPYTVREFGEQDSIPTSIALAIDQSGSMKGVKDVLDLGTEMFIRMKRPCDFISLTGFHQEITSVFPLSSDTTMMLSEFREYKKHSQGLFSRVYDGILKALATLDKVPVEQPKVCVVFADGEENTSSAKSAQIYEYATRHNISIYTVGFAYANDDELQALALYTGGKYYRAYTKRDLIAIFMDIYRSLQNYYMVTYVPPTYDGLHMVDVSVAVPGRDTMIATGQYDRTPKEIIFDAGEFNRYIQFAYNRSDIDSSSTYIIDELAEALERYERVYLEVQGHTDNIGGEEFNQRLSEARANAVRDALIARGIDPKRLRARGFGFSVPVESNDTEAGRAKNRRTVFRILRK
jgi:outer membrane protein OmpA-like peptidoglycan-associated protein